MVSAFPVVTHGHCAPAKIGGRGVVERKTDLTRRLNSLRRWGAEATQPSTATRKGAGREPHRLGAKAEEGFQGGAPRGARRRRCRGGVTRAGVLSQAEARSRPDEAEAEAHGENDQGSERQGREAFTKPLPIDDRGSYARAGGRKRGGQKTQPRERARPV